MSVAYISYHWIKRVLNPYNAIYLELRSVSVVYLQ